VIAKESDRNMVVSIYRITLIGELVDSSRREKIIGTIVRISDR